MAESRDRHRRPRLPTRPSRQTTGRLLLDEEILAEEGITDFMRYAIEPGQPLLTGLFLS